MPEFDVLTLVSETLHYANDCCSSSSSRAISVTLTDNTVHGCRHGLVYWNCKWYRIGTDYYLDLICHHVCQSGMNTVHIHVCIHKLTLQV